MATVRQKKAEENKLEKFDMNQIAYKSDNHKKELFVSLFNQLMGHVSNTCAAVPISRDTYYRWLDEDKAFATAVMESEMNLNDEIRDVLINKAASGDMTAVIFYLKKRHPEFKEQAQTTLVQNNFYEKAAEEAEEFIK